MRKNKNVILFLVKFFVTYFLLVTVYNGYLKKTQQKQPTFKTAPITALVASQTVSLLDFFGYNAVAEQHEEELSVKLILNNRFTARVIEGCNSISMIILFVAFIIAFTGSLKATVVFSVLGSVFIYIINIIRIAILTVLIYKYPQQQDLLHSIVFPAIIYGAVFMLWVLWVEKFSNYKK